MFKVKNLLVKNIVFEQFKDNLDRIALESTRVLPWIWATNVGILDESDLLPI